MSTRDVTQRVRDAIAANPISAYTAVLRIEPTRKPGLRESVTICPFHSDEHASLNINLDKCVWICRAGCGGGDLFDLGARIWGTTGDFLSTQKRLASLLGVALTDGNGHDSDKKKVRLTRTV